MGGLIGLGGLGGNVGGIAGGAGGAGGGCARYEIVSARGTGEIQTNPTGSAGFLRGVLSAVPGGSKYEVVYPADVNYAVSPGRGAKNIDEHIRPKLASCPNEVFVFFGYSEGAMVVTQYMKNFKFPTDKLAAIVLYGNPHHTSGATQNVCTGKTGVGIASPLRIVMPAAPASVTFDCCNQGDMICQTGGTMGPHLTYPNSRNEKDAIAYTVGKLKAKLSKEGGNDADNDKGKAKGEGNGGNKGGGDGK
ncbi:cutinase-domain-containing protein [Phakopsora pachyrhizi]|uniref:Cutinase-domain-containing protein n=1 Tax=Phakopsora pachyrhizi TaxID=170000 RepID=A0AAV0BFG2_PHAPC|nr:cutinase-domain-containing protein [Phakopsora pachyrhizi]